MRFTAATDVPSRATRHLQDVWLAVVPHLPAFGQVAQEQTGRIGNQVQRVEDAREEAVGPDRLAALGERRAEEQPSGGDLRRPAERATARTFAESIVLNACQCTAASCLTRGRRLCVFRAAKSI